MTKKMVLGKGLESLIKKNHDVIRESGYSEESSSTRHPLGENPLLVDVDTITSNPRQPRRRFHQKELVELAESIRENGIIQPLIVTKMEKGFELIAGERRLKAAKLVGLDKVPVVLKRGTDQDKMVMAIIENIQRKDLNCVEEGLAYFKLMNEFNLTQEDVAKRLGKERSGVANYLRLLKLPRPVLEMLQQEVLTFGHGKVLAGISEIDKVILLAQKAKKEQLSVRELENLIKGKAGRKTLPDKNPRWDDLSRELEQKTGLAFSILSKKNGKGYVQIRFDDREEFNRVYEFLISR